MLRSIRDQMQDAVDILIEAAACEYSIPIQKSLLKVCISHLIDEIK